MTYNWNEFYNDCKHFLYGTMVSWTVLAIMGLGYDCFFPLPGLLVASWGWACVEFCQFLYHDNQEIRLPDRVKDWLVVTFAASTPFLLYIWR